MGKNNLRAIKKFLKENPNATLIPSLPDNYNFYFKQAEIPVWKNCENETFVIRGFSFEKDGKI